MCASGQSTAAALQQLLHRLASAEKQAGKHPWLTSRTRPTTTSPTSAEYLFLSVRTLTSLLTRSTTPHVVATSRSFTACVPWPLQPWPAS